MKRCPGCGRDLTLGDFHRDRTKPDGRQRLCKRCNIERNQRWYREHPEARVERMDDYARRRRARLQVQLYDYLLLHPCIDCGEADPVVLDFDHLRDKVANVSAMVYAGRPWAVIRAEIEKCEVVCANCHRRRTAARGSSFRHRRGRESSGD